MSTLHDQPPRCWGLVLVAECVFNSRSGAEIPVRWWPAMVRVPSRAVCSRTASVAGWLGWRLAPAHLQYLKRGAEQRLKPSWLNREWA
jgi:hypothetical protein